MPPTEVTKVPASSPSNAAPIKDGDRCRVSGGAHKGKLGIVRDLNISKTGHLTITVVQKNGDRFKTLAKNVQVVADA